MALVFEEFTLTLSKRGPTGTQWAVVVMKLQETEGRTYHEVRTEVLIPQDFDGSLPALRQYAAQRAVPIVEAALGLLRERPVAQLVDATTARDQRLDDDVASEPHWSEEPPLLPD